MKILRITGASGTGKTVAIQALQKKYGGTIVLAERNQARVTRATIKEIITSSRPPARVYIDFEGRPTPALEAYIVEALEAAGTQFLTLAHN